MQEVTKGTRIINFLVDIIAMIIIYIPLSLSLVNYLNLSLLYYLTFFGYFFLFEYFTKGRTLGKIVTKTKVVTLKNETPSILRIFWRSFLRLNPFDILSFLCGQNGHDAISRTKLVSLESTNIN